MRQSKAIPKQSSKAKYDEPVKQALQTVWYAANQICSKRLVPFLPELVDNMQTHGHLNVNPDTRRALLSISASTVDRLLRPSQQFEKGIILVQANLRDRDFHSLAQKLNDALQKIPAETGTAKFHRLLCKKSDFTHQEAIHPKRPAITAWIQELAMTGSAI